MTLKLEIEHKRVYSLALQQSGQPLIDSIALQNLDSSPLENLTVQLQLKPDLGNPVTHCIEKIHGGEGEKFSPSFRIPYDKLKEVLEEERVELSCVVYQGEEEIQRYEEEIILLAYNAFNFSQYPLQSYACFVTPNHPVISQILKQVSETLRKNRNNPSLEGYQSRNPNRVYEMVKGLYETFAHFGIRYINPPASFMTDEGFHQKIRFPDQVFYEQLGTCADLTPLATSCLEQMGLHPVMVLVKGHVFPGVWRIENHPSQSALVTSYSTVLNWVESGDLLLFDSSTYAQHPQPPFQDAVQNAINCLNKFWVLIDVHLARQEGFKPIPIRMSAVPEVTETVEDILPAAQQILQQAAQAQVATDAEETETSQPPEETKIEDVTVQGRVNQWKYSLLDLSVKNRLLNISNLDFSQTIFKTLFNYLQDNISAIFENTESISEEDKAEIIDRLSRISSKDIIAQNKFSLIRQFSIDYYLSPLEQQFGQLAQAVFQTFQEQISKNIFQEINKKLRNRKSAFFILDIPSQLLPQFEDYVASGKKIKLIGQSSQRQVNTGDEQAEAEALAYQTAELAKGNCRTVFGLGFPLNQSDADIYTIGKTLEKQARIAEEETGYSTLYLALGLLQWRDKKNNNAPRLAPLFLYPLDIKVDRATGNVFLQHADSEPIGNITLVEKLKQDFNLNLEVLENPPEDDSGFDITEILQTVRRIIAQYSGWFVFDSAVVTNFSFGKFLLWRDLHDNADQLLSKETVRHIASGGREQFSDPIPNFQLSELDQVSYGDFPIVMEADSSQIGSVYTALQGRSFVLQGPPGTGKSQTITNLIAAFMSQGKSVLFVSEKMAALSVVQRRLAQVGLEEFCLELHSNQVSRKAIIDQLGQALKLNQDQVVEWERLSKKLNQYRDHLKEYVSALHRPRNLGLSLFEALNQILVLNEFPKLSPPAISLNNLTAERFEHLTAIVENYAKTLHYLDDSAQVWSFSQLSQWSLSLQEKVEDILASLVSNIHKIQTEIDTYTEKLNLPDTISASSLYYLISAHQHLKTQALPSLIFDSPKWNQFLETVQGWLNRQQNLQATEQEISQRWKATFFQLDLSTEIERWERIQNSFFLIRWLRSFFQRRRFQKMARNHLGNNTQIIRDLRAVQELNQDYQSHAEEKESLQKDLGECWSSGTPEALEKIVDLGKEVRETIADLLNHSEMEIDFSRLTDESIAPEKLSTLAEQFSSLSAQLEELIDLVKGSSSPSWLQESLTDLKHRLETLLENANQLKQWCQYYQSWEQLNAENLEAVATWYQEGKVPSSRLKEVFQGTVLKRWFVREFDQEEILRNFDGLSHQEKLDAFQQLDQEYIEASRLYVRQQLIANLPSLQISIGGSEMGILQREQAKQKRHLPIRSLFQSLPNLLPKLKSCFLMSPLSVAQYLPADAKPFNVVIFDEASQVETHDAIGAIARGKQVIVVGDSKQMPPTNFFGRSNSDDESPHEDELVELESILDEAIACQFPQQMLQWHYRSRHETLIQFSNQNYYDSQLNIFPAASRHPQNLGLKWHPVSEGMYRTGERTNRKEAEALVNYLCGRLEQYSPQDRSFGIITFSIPQQLLIENLIDEARRNRPALEVHFSSEQTSESVFIKNLENVQGDERDEILFSICYAPNEQGKLSMNFGALNRMGGERRLNVAVTRARQMLNVFSTLRADQIDLSRTGAVGARHLKDFLAFAEQWDAQAQEKLIKTDDADSEVQRQIYETLLDMGYQVDCQVGCASYRIDFAVIHPDDPQCYAIGIECDGERYANAKTVRDRDRVQPLVLSRMGWHLHRVWSLEWQFNRDREKERLQKAVEGAIAASREQTTPASPLSTPPSREFLRMTQPTAEQSSMKGSFAQAVNPSPQTIPTETMGQPYQEAELSVASENAEDLYKDENLTLLHQQIKHLVEVEAPIHQKEVTERIAKGSWGVRRLTQRVRERISEPIQQLHRQEQVYQKGEFIWRDRAEPTNWQQFRDFSQKTGTTKLEQIAPEEIAAAMIHVISLSLSITSKDLYQEVIQCLGKRQLSSSHRELLERVQRRLLHEGKIKEENGRLHLNSAG
ncbi:MAG: DUF3320 domain-containing protein [Halothece sp.]